MLSHSIHQNSAVSLHRLHQNQTVAGHESVGAQTVGLHDGLHRGVEFLGYFPETVSGLHDIAHDAGHGLQPLQIRRLRAHALDHRDAHRLECQHVEGHHGLYLHLAAA